MPRGTDVIVIGGGVVGSACARALALAGQSVTVLQRLDTPGEGWRAAAGMLAAQIEARPDDPLFNLALAGRSFYRRNAEALSTAEGGIGLLECGILHVAQTAEAAEAAKAKVAWQRQQGYRADWLSPEEITQGWPWLAPGTGGFWAPEDGALDPLRTVAAFRSSAVNHGAKIINDQAVGLDRDGDRLLGVIGQRDRYSAGHVVIASGAWSGRLEHLPRPVSVEPVRGQMAAFDWPAGVEPAIAYGERCYLLKRGDEMLVGATMEHAGFEIEAGTPALTELLERAAVLCPALSDATPKRRWAGLRPGTPDGLPIIGPEPRLPGLWYATGHGRNGILLAGITGEIIAQGIGGDPIPDELMPLRPTRFWNW